MLSSNSCGSKSSNLWGSDVARGPLVEFIDDIHSLDSNKDFISISQSLYWIKKGSVWHLTGLGGCREADVCLPRPGHRLHYIAGGVHTLPQPLLQVISVYNQFPESFFRWYLGVDFYISLRAYVLCDIFQHCNYQYCNWNYKRVLYLICYVKDVLVF